MCKLSKRSELVLTAAKYAAAHGEATTPETLTKATGHSRAQLVLLRIDTGLR